MKGLPLAIPLLLTFLLLPASATPQGDISLTYSIVTASSLDWKGGMGISDPTDPNNPCTMLLYGARIPGTSHYDMPGINLNGPAIGVSDQGLGKEDTPPGIPLGITCPIPGAGPDSLFLTFDGMNWRSAQGDSIATMNLCTLEAITVGCLPVVDGHMRLMAAACDDDQAPGGQGGYLGDQPGGDGVVFYSNYIDGKGAAIGGGPWDSLQVKNDAIHCSIYHAHDYTSTVQQFSTNYASQSFEFIKNENVVHTGRGTGYMVTCWQLGYLDFNVSPPVYRIALSHDWKLVLDVGTPAGWPSALESHYGGAQPGDAGKPVGAATFALRGFYSQSVSSSGTYPAPWNHPGPGNAYAGSWAGTNGFGPCLNGPAPTSPESKKPAPLV